MRFTRHREKIDSAAMLKFIRGFIESTGESPTLQQLANRYGVSITCVHDAILRLEEAGEITRTKGHKRIRISESKAA